MIIRNEQGDFDISGTVVYLSDLWSYYDKSEVLKDMQEGKISAHKWTDETTDIEKLQDFLEGKTVLSGLITKKYLDYKSFIDSDSVKFSELKKMLNKRFESYEIMMRSILFKLNELLSQFCQDKFIGLKEIAEDYSYRGRQIYTLKSLRNKIRSERFGNMEVGHLDIDDLHITLMKRGMKWITPLVHWQTERNKLSYNHYWRAFSRKKFCTKVCVK